MRTRVKQVWAGDFTEWTVERQFLKFFWLPIGRWLHQDWWAPWYFETVAEAEAFSIRYRVMKRHSPNCDPRPQ